MTHFLLSFGTRSWLFAIFAFSILCARYLLISGGAYLFAWKVFGPDLSRRRIQLENRKPLRITSEIFWSILSFAVLAIQAGLIHALFVRGHTRLMTSWSQMPWWYHFTTFFILFVIHDAYFYWMHRVLHLRLFFRYVHTIHHKSINPTPFAAFAFHPFEAVAEMLFLAPVVLWLPVHVELLILFLIMSHMFNVIGHLGYEVFPHATWHAWWGSWITTSTHHNLHHQYFSGNYGLYLKMWDKACGTLNPKTESEFLLITNRNAKDSLGSLT